MNYGASRQATRYQASCLGGSLRGAEAVSPWTASASTPRPRMDAALGRQGRRQ